MITLHTKMGTKAITVNDDLASHRFDNGCHATAALFLVLDANGKPDHYEIGWQAGGDYDFAGEARVACDPPEVDTWELHLLEMAMRDVAVQNLLARGEFDLDYYTDWIATAQRKLGDDVTEHATKAGKADAISNFTAFAVDERVEIDDSDDDAVQNPLRTNIDTNQYVQKLRDMHKLVFATWCTVYAEAYVEKWNARCNGEMDAPHTPLE